MTGVCGMHEVERFLKFGDARVVVHAGRVFRELWVLVRHLYRTRARCEVDPVVALRNPNSIAQSSIFHAAVHDVPLASFDDAGVEHPLDACFWGEVRSGQDGALMSPEEGSVRIGGRHELASRVRA